MGERRTLVLRMESLTELTGRELHDVIGGGTQLTACDCTYSILNCSGWECPSVPNSCVVCV